MDTPPFTISDEILSLVAEISMSIGSITALMQDDAPNPVLRKENRIKTIQSSLAIENNSLTIDQVTAIMEGKRVLGAPNEIQEVKNAIDAYHLMQQINPHSEKDLLKAHRLMMQDLIKENGKYRSSGVGVFGNEGIVHLAPPPTMVPQLMANLFEWIKTTKTHPLVSSCVFHYEFEFIHPFADGNGRMGRFWQTALLARFNPVFLWLPVETIVKKHQQDYYNVIAECDAKGDSTKFIEFMLRCIKQSIDDVKTLKATPKATPKEILLTLINHNNKVTIQQIAAAWGINKRNAQNRINQYVDEGLIRRIGSARGGYWEIC
ncbi:MAG: Fic family protein [Bacteroidales bacterium]|nr:Fic family protein [Bacteroidales bacterium]